MSCFSSFNILLFRVLVKETTRISRISRISRMSRISRISRMSTILPSSCFEKLPVDVVGSIFEFGPDHRERMKQTLNIISSLSMSYLCLGYNRYKNNVKEMEIKYPRSITDVRRIHRFAVEVTLFHERVYRIYTDTEFPFHCPFIRFVKHVHLHVHEDEDEKEDENKDGRKRNEQIKVEQLWSPSKTLAILVIQYDYYNFIKFQKNS